MRISLIAAMLLATALVATAAEELLKSGPPVGKELPGTFQPLNITGPDAGQKTCIFCEYAERPVAMVFARETSEPLTRLIKRLDDTTAKHGATGLASFVVFLGEDEKLVKQIKQVAEAGKFQHTPLRTFKSEGPKDYNLAKEADITVVFFIDRVVKLNRCFPKGKLQERDTEAMVAEIVNALPAKK